MRAILLACVVVLGASGCATYPVVAQNSERVGVFVGDFGVTGHNNRCTVQRGSHIRKLSIIGDGNSIMVDEGATVGKVEIWGGKNTVNVPEGLIVRMTQVGNGNQLIYRPRKYSNPEAEPVPTISVTETAAPIGAP